MSVNSPVKDSDLEAPEPNPSIKSNGYIDKDVDPLPPYKTCELFGDTAIAAPRSHKPETLGAGDGSEYLAFHGEDASKASNLYPPMYGDVSVA
jgi:hypothetical protein